jgi:ubiquinone biosynthesis protein
VVVKLRRPGIEDVIVDDLALLRQLARALARAWPEARRLRPEEVVEDYAHTILGELDFLAEAANTSQLRRNFRASPLLYVPKVHWPLCRENVLVLERIYATPIGDLDALRAAGTDFKVLADRGVETFFTQVFEDNFFHADMHPGNIFVDLTDPKNPSYIAIDCAIIGTLTDADQTYLARNLLAFFNQDYAEVARLHVASGWVPAHTDVDAFEAVIREVCEPLFAQPLAEISFGHFLLTLFDTARAFDMTVQPQLVLLQKTLLNIEGLGRQLYPELDLWQTAKPFMERWLARQLNPLNRVRLHLEPLLAAAQSLPGLPAREAARDETIRNLETRLAALQAQPPRTASRPLGAAVLLSLGVGLTAGLSPALLGPLALLAGGLLLVLPRRHP